VRNPAQAAKREGRELSLFVFLECVPTPRPLHALAVAAFAAYFDRAQVESP